MTLTLRRDPSRTTMLRRRFIADINRRFKRVSKAVWEFVVVDDAFGLEDKSTFVVMRERQAFRFSTDAQKIGAYHKWLQQQIDADILTVDSVTAKPWTSTYIESAYKKGMARAYTDVHSIELAESVDFYKGSKAQFLQDAFSAPEVLSKIELVSIRAFEELRGVTATMSQQLSRALANGLAHGYSPAKIAREMQKSIGSLTRTRARMIARTEIISAHAEGQLDSFERLGVEEVGIMAEWTTAGDERVCPECGALEGEVMTIDEARGMIPLHPNCRCDWLPAIKKSDRISEVGSKWK